MTKSEIGDRLAGRLESSNAVAKGYVDGVFEAIGEALVNGEAVRLAGSEPLPPGAGLPVPGATPRPAKCCPYRLRRYRHSKPARPSETR